MKDIFLKLMINILKNYSFIRKNEIEKIEKLVANLDGKN